MKISVGQVLLVVGVGTYIVLGPLNGADKATIFIGDARDVAAAKFPQLGFLRRGKAPVKPAPAPTVPAPVAPPALQDKLPAAEASPIDKSFSEVPLTPVPPLKVDEPSAVSAAPAVARAEPTPAGRPAGHRHRRNSARAAAAAAAASAEAPSKKAASKKSTDSLVGTYVSLTLKTGNAVKGMLVEHTATNYKIELPGMGAFDYPANTVKSVSAAE